MHDHDLALLAYAKLAEISQAKQQHLPRDKFLVLAGVEACQAGLPDVAARCRELILAHNPAHLLKKFDPFSAALSNPDFQLYLKQLAKFCSFERAESLLSGLQIDLPALAAAPSAEISGIVLAMLQGPLWNPHPK